MSNYVYFLLKSIFNVQLQFSLPQITLQYSCARLTGLDSRGGVLLLGSTHFYVIEGVTISNHGDLVDMETAPDQYVLTVLQLYTVHSDTSV